jgi:hypothetical protein
MGGHRAEVKGYSHRESTQGERRPIVSKQGLKGPSDYHPNEMAVKAAKWGGHRAELKGYSHRESTQGESWTTALNLAELGQKAAHQKKTSLQIRKSYSLFLRVILKKGDVDDGDDDDE